jgi:NitT/TauT family transport system permease protein
VGSERGLGYLILVSSSQINTALAFASMILLSVMSIVLFYLLEWIERLVVPWAQE